MLPAGLAVVLLTLAASLGAGDQSGRQLPALPPFLDVFQSTHQITVATQQVEWTSAVGKHEGLLARSDDDQRLPALVVIASGDAGNEFYARTAHELAQIGYAALVVEIEAKSTFDASDVAARERTLARLSAAVRWLRDRDDVFADRIGVLGWDDSAAWALELAADQHLQACVLCDGRLPRQIGAAAASQLRDAGVLLIRGTAGGSLLDGELAAQFSQSLDEAGVEHRLFEFDEAKPGFMAPGRKEVFNQHAADRAWFETYEFLGHHVEDADVKQLLADRATGASQPLQQLATIADLMRAVNAPTGVRGQLALSLQELPADEKAWKLVGSRAALMADSGELLVTLTPPQGSTASWLRHTIAYRDAAAAISAAAGRHDLAAAQQALLRLNETCGKCHLDHR